MYITTNILQGLNKSGRAKTRAAIEVPGKMFCFRRVRRPIMEERPPTARLEAPEPIRPTPLEETETVVSIRSENRVLRREIEKMREELAQVKCILKLHETELKVVRGTSYDSAIVWRVSPVSSLFMEDLTKKELPDSQYTGRDIHSIPFYSSR